MTTAFSPKVTRRERWAWYFYDFGNSAYAAVVLLAVYSAYFQGQVVGGAEGSRLWGIAVGIAMLVVAITSPFLGAIADYSGFKKRFLLFYTAVAILFTAALFFVTPGRVFIGMLFFIIAEIGYRSAQVFYNALLPHIASSEEMGRVSGNGWAIGTAGGILCLLIILPLIVMVGGTQIVRISLVITAVFWAISAIPIFRWLPETSNAQPLPPGETYFSLAIKQLRQTMRTAGQFREFVKFLIAFLIYNDGIIMALNFAAIIGAVLFGLEQQDLIIFVIIVQVSNVFGAFAFGWAVERFGGRQALIAALLLMITAVFWLYFNKTVTGFYAVGVLAGFAMAGAQSVSRTMVGLLAPPGQSGEFYGIFAVAGRTSSFIGPTVYGIVAAEMAQRFQAAGETAVVAEQMGQRTAILTIVAFVFIGLLMLLTVNEQKERSG